jgi:hypothetical protein
MNLTPIRALAKPQPGQYLADPGTGAQHNVLPDTEAGEARNVHPASQWL